MGAVIGAGVVGYKDYKENGKVFSGKKTAGDYLKGALIGGVVGAVVGAVVGGIAAAGGVGAAATAAGKAVTSAASYAGSKIAAAGSAIASQGQKIMEGAKNVAHKIGNAISNTANKIGDKISSGIQKVKGGMNSVNNNASSVVNNPGQPGANPIKVIGHYPEYMEMSNKLGVRPFSIPTPIWNGMTEVQKWTANQKFLDRAIAKGTEFILSTPLDKMRPGSFFAQEINYLINSAGYTLSADKLRLIP
ncbi:MAG: hypothetical protein ACOYJD_03495 [Christensenellales bacterium]